VSGAEERLGLSYTVNKTRQHLGRIAEKTMAKERGARLHPGSGAGKIKDDASTEDIVYEFKNAKRSHTLTGAALKALYSRAVRQNKLPVYVIHFEDVGLTATVSLTKERKKQ